MPVTVRPSVEDDVAAVAAIYAHHVWFGTASFETDPPSEAEMAARRAAVTSREPPYLVAAEDDSVVGYAYAGPYRPRAAYGQTVENSIYLQPGLVGRGIGRTLLMALVAACEALDLRKWWRSSATAGIGVNPAARALRLSEGSACCNRSAGNTVGGSTACCCNARWGGATPRLHGREGDRCCAGAVTPATAL